MSNAIEIPKENNAQLGIVEFLGTRLTVANEGDRCLVALKPISDSIGLSWAGQLERIKRDEVLATCMRVIRTQLVGDTQAREAVFLPIDMLNGWLFGVESSRCRQEIRPALVRYKRECYAALAAYWQERRSPAVSEQVCLLAPEQFERHLCYFRGARVEFIVGNGRVWGKAAHICNVLGVRSSDRLARSLSEGRKLRRKIGQQKHLYIDPEAVIKASDYCPNRELASAWNDWAVKTMNGFGVGQPAMPLVVKDAESLSPAARYGISQLLDTRLLVTLDESGAVQVKPLARGALFVTAERLARLLEDPFAIPAEHLPGIMQAVAGRMGRVMQHSLSRS